ncbi:glycosyltransferase [Desulforamulus aeronauticus]|uniref:Glycosyltransferase involved in cell wall bisynthesis n=1 Tax=Desulforamulus aeronauticus DSM 10349 TaxID=1121421 RepID=A0A1M6VJZ4_9FIRM|nr:glycosyltransferase [Desulforamulus aeronauticus]SHK81779.1 Glycosyltransferase involved in cell wall bisynthesis [Desulforamulus aeronauticus DSM 10349]
MSEMAQVHWIPGTVDTFVDKKMPDQAFEQTEYLHVGLTHWGNLYRTLLRFKLPANIADNQIWFASLVLYLCKNDYPNYAKEFGVFSVEGNWEQGNVTWNNQPHPKEGIISGIFIEDKQDCLVEWDISPLIKKLTNKSVWNLELRSLNEHENSLVSFFSRHCDLPDKQPVLRLVTEKLPAALADETFQADYSAQQKYYQLFLHGPLPPESLEILSMIKHKKYQAIVVYTETKNIEPLARPQQFLKELTVRGYLGFVCRPTDENYKIEEIADNLFSVNRPEFLLPIVRSQAVLILCTDVSQTAWSDLLPHKFLWYDMVEDWELSRQQDSYRLEKHESLVKEADLVTYSKSQLKKYIFKNPNTLYLPDEKDPWSSLLDQVESVIKVQPKGWTLFSNIEARGKINVMTETFLNFEGKEFYSGGAERYLIDLAQICSDLGFIMNIYQHGDFPWLRRFRNIDVISLARGSLNSRALNSAQQFNRQFYEQVQESSLLNIYSAFYQAYPLAATPNIGISHGVSWDNPFYSFQHIDQFFRYNKRFLLGAKICEQVLSVDTNTANWFQTIDYELGQKIKVISNYVDLERFYPAVNDQVGDRIIILYPRRLYEARGFYLVLEILDNILDQFPNVEFHFVGKGFENDTKYVIEKQNKWPGRVTWYSLPPEEMPTAYKSADISLIPTLYSEGTSLSCLEAMACGNAVIVSRIGGLTDLVIDGFNGLRIEPNAASLGQAIKYLLRDQDALAKFKRNARLVAETFSKTTWTKEWTTLIKQKIQSNIPPLTANPSLIKIYLTSMPDKNSKIGYLITTLLSHGYLVYVLVKNTAAHSQLSFGRIQWVNWQEEGLAAADFIIADQQVAGDIEQRVQLTLTDAWLESFCLTPEHSLSELAIP